MRQTAFCAACNAAVPVVSRHAGKAIGTAVGSVIAGIVGKGFWSALAGAVAGAAAGTIVDEFGQNVCNHCGCAVKPTA